MHADARITLGSVYMTKMKLVVVLCGLFMIFAATNAAATLIPLDEISVTGTTCTRQCTAGIFYPEATIDGDVSTFWHGENNLLIGEVDFLTYHFAQLYELTTISFITLDPKYTMGELDLQWSSNGAAWTTFAHLPGDTTGSHHVIPVGGIETQWIQLRAEYQGRGAHGQSPAHYLREIYFEVGQAVPEPSSLLLVVSGVIGLLCKRRFQL